MKLFSTILLYFSAFAAISSLAFARGYADNHPVVADHNVDLDVMIPLRPISSLNKNLSPMRKSPAKAPLAGGFTLCGALLNSSDFTTTYHPYGIYTSVSDNEGNVTVTPNVVSPDYDATAGSCLTSEGYLITGAKKYMGYYIVDHYLYDPSDWSLIGKTAGDMESMARSLTAVGSTLYGSFINLDGTFSFSSLDVKKFSKKKIVARMEHPYSALAASADGTIFAIDFEGNLLTVDKKSGKETLVAAIGLPSEYTTSAVMSNASDRIYYVQARSDASELFSIDPATGETLSLGIYPSGEQWQGLFLPVPEAPAGAPAMPANLKVSFAPPSMEGLVAFTMPEYFFGGAPAEGILSWSLCLDREEVGVGEAIPDEKVEVAVSVPVSGRHLFEVVCSNEAGMGPAASIEYYVGYDSPAPVSGINLGIDSATGHATLSWFEPVTGEHDEYFNPTLLSYDIVRYPEADTVAASLSATRFEEDILLPESQKVVYYGITPIHAGIRGKETLSAKISLGEITFPYVHSFKGPDALDGFNVVDANNDGITWTADPDGSAYVSYAPRVMNDWLISAPIYMQKGMVYPFFLDAWSQTARHDERIAFWIGKGNTPADMDHRLLNTILDGHPEPIWIQVTVPEDGYYHFGIQGCSLPSQYFLRLDSITLGVPYAQSVPAPPTFISVAPDSNGELSLSGYVFLSGKAADGSPQNSLDYFVLKCGDRIVKEMENPTPGVSFSFSENFDEPGRYDYTAYVRGYNGESQLATASVYVGVNIARNPVPGVVMSEDGLYLRWLAPQKGENGLQLNTKGITYHIYDSEFREIGVTSATEFPLEISEEAPSVATWYVKAETSAGINPDWKGSAGIYNHGCYETGIFNTTADSYFPLAYLLHDGENTGQPGWNRVALPDGSAAWESAPGDDTPDVSRECVAVFPAITVGPESPAVCFSFPEGVPEEELLSVYAVRGDEWTRLERISYDAAASDEAIYDLSSFIGGMVNVAIVTTGRTVVKSCAIEYLQPLSVRIATSCEESVHAPGVANLPARITNHGKNASGPFDVALYATPSGSGEYVKTASFKVDNIEGRGSMLDVELPLKLPQFDEYDTYSYYFTLEGVEGNDSRYEKSSVCQLLVADLSYPHPLDLEAAVDPELTSVSLVWQTPLGLDSNDAYVSEADGTVYPLTGYKVYADRRLIGETVEPRFTDILEDGDYATPIERRYNVVAVYGNRESFPGDDCLVSLSQIDDVAISPDGYFTAVKEADRVRISGVEGMLSIYTPDGKMVGSILPDNGSVTLRLLPGVYILRDNRTSVSIRL